MSEEKNTISLSKEETVSQPEQQNGPEKNNLVPVLAVLGAVCVIGIAIAAFLFLGKKSVSNEYIKVENYSNLEIVKVEEETVSDEDVDAAIESNVMASQELVEKKGKAKEGDIANIDYVGSVKGKKFDGGSAEAYDLELGSGMFIGANGDYKGFEEQIIGHKAGDKFDIKVKFPEDYQSEELAGKVATFAIKVNKVQEYSKPELNDEWVQANSDKSKTVDEYKAEIRESMEKENKDAAQATLRGEVLEALNKNITIIKSPEKETNEIKDQIIANYKSYAEMYGMEFGDFLQAMMGYTEEQFEQQAQEAAENSAVTLMACNLIAEKEKLIPSEEEYKKKYDELAELYGYESGDALVEQVGKEDVNKSILQDIVCDYLIEHAKQVDPEEASTEELQMVEESTEGDSLEDDTEDIVIEDDTEAVEESTEAAKEAKKEAAPESATTETAK